MNRGDIVKVVLAAIIDILLVVIITMLGDIASTMPRPEECGMCGAHVYQTWHVKADDGEFIHICERCADIVDGE